VIWLMLMMSSRLNRLFFFSALTFRECNIALRTTIKIANTDNIEIAIRPPYQIKPAIRAAPIKAAKAVANHPPTTFKTPETRYTALSLSQARSDSDVPMATIKVTYVVESGNLRLVPTEMRIA